MDKKEAKELTAQKKKELKEKEKEARELTAQRTRELKEKEKENKELAAQQKKELKEKKKEARELSIRQKKEIKEELKQKRAEYKHESKELSDKLKTMLETEVRQARSKEKRRTAEILGVFARHNFYAGGFSPEELRTTLEDLGPTYVKIGQIMSSRVDMLPESYCKELGKLRSNVKQLDPAVARAVIEQESGKPIDELFDEFRDEPLGSASIAQAHYGRLKDGTEVVVKVQRPLIADMMRKDFVLLKKLSKVFNAVSEGSEEDETGVDLVSVIEEMEAVTEEELDFRVEADNTRFFREYCIEDETKVSCPTIIDELSTERILTMTFVDGCSISKKERLIEEGYDVNEIGRNMVLNYIHQVLDVGTFHADPHQGNIMVSHGIPYWIDFGMVGHITEASINLIQDLIFALLERDLETLVSAVTSMGAVSPKTNRAKLMEDLDVLIDKYMSVRSLSDLDMTGLLDDLSAICSKHYIKMPGEFTMLVRSLLTIEGVIEEFCPELNLFELISNKLMDRAKENFDLEQKLLSAGKDVLAVSKKAAKIPALTSDVLTGIVKGRTKVNLELTGYDELVNKTLDTVKTIILAVFSCFLLLGSCILCTTDIEPKTSTGMPLIAVLGFIFSIGLAIYTVKRMKSKKG